MSKSNTNLQTQASNALHMAIMEAVNSSTIVSKIHHTRINGLRKQFQLLKVVLKQLHRDHSHRDKIPISHTVDACESMVKIIIVILQNHQVNVQFLLQLQPEWQRFVTLVKQSQELKTVSYHKLYDILKQHQNEVNEIRADRLAQPDTVTEDDEMSKDKEIEKLMALIFSCLRKSTNIPTTTFDHHQTPVELIKIILQELTDELEQAGLERMILNDEYVRIRNWIKHSIMYMAQIHEGYSRFS
ncbi:hypothetical protein Tco_0928459 [Tanacetum coccineum]